MNRKSLMKLGVASFLILSVFLLGFLLINFVFPSFATSYSLVSGLSVVLNSPGNFTYVNNTSFVSNAPFRNINFTFTPTWNETTNLQNATLFGNFTVDGTWVANATNATALANATLNGINFTVASDGVYLWNIVIYNATGLSDTHIVNWTVTVDTVTPVLTLIYPADGSYIYGNTSEPFTVNVTDSNLNTTVMLRWRVSGQTGWPRANETMTCSWAAPNYRCVKGLNFGAEVDDGETVQFYINASDNTGNEGSTGTASSPRSTTVDRIAAPAWSGYNESYVSGSPYNPGRNLGFQITITDNYKIGNATIEHNFTGFLSNYSVGNTTPTIWKYNITTNGTADYSIKWFMNDSAGNWNSSTAWTYTIAQNTSTQNMLFLMFNQTGNANKTYVYPEAVNATGVTNITEGYLTLYRNNANLTSSGTWGEAVESNQTLGNATWNFTLYFPETINYTRAQREFLVLVNKGNITIRLALNGTEGNNTYEYPRAINATGWRNSSATNEGNLSLWRGGVIVSSALDSYLLNISEDIRLGNATYNYSLTWTSTNYTSDSITVDRFALVSKGPTSVTLSLNTSTTDKTIPNGAGVNASVVPNNTEGVVFIYNTSGSNVIQLGTTPALGTGADVFNETAYTGLPGASFNITAYYNDSQNYSASSLSTRWIFIESTKPTGALNAPNITNNTILGWNTTRTINISAIWNDTVDTVYTLQYWWLWHNATSGTGTNQSAVAFLKSTNTSWYNFTLTGVSKNSTVIAKFYVNDTSGNENVSEIVMWKVDGTAPVLNDTTPVNGSAIVDGSTEQLMQVNVYDHVLNTSNVTLHWRRAALEWNDTTQLTCYNQSYNKDIAIDGAPVRYICNATIAFGWSSGYVLQFYFTATDNSSIINNLGSSASPLTATVNQNSPSFFNVEENVTTTDAAGHENVIGKYDAINISVQWTDDTALGYAKLETNESGTAQNKTSSDSPNYGSPMQLSSNISWSNFTWTNSSMAKGVVISVRAFANDSAGNENVTGYVNFTIDTEVPQQLNGLDTSVNTSNASTIAKGAQISFTANWTDNVRLGYYTTWYNYTNGSTPNGANTTWAAFSAGNYTNSSAILNTSAIANGYRLQAKFFVNDSSGNENVSQFFEWTIDSTSPQVSINETNVTIGSTIAKGTAVNLSATWTDDIQMNYWWVETNDSTQPSAPNGNNITTSYKLFTLTNVSNYSIDTLSFTTGQFFWARIWVNDTSGNENKTVTFNWTIDGIVPTFGNITSGNATDVNGTESVYNPGMIYYFNITWSDNIEISKVFFEWNGTPNETITASTANYSITKTDLAFSNAKYTFRWFANDSSNNWIATALWTFNITKNATEAFIGLALNGTEADTAYIYPVAVNATGWRNFTEVGNLSLWRNGTIVNSSLTSNIAPQEILLGNGTYNYTLTFDATNYTNRRITNRVALVNKGNVTIRLAFNDTENDVVYVYPKAVNATGWRNSTFANEGTLSLWRNDTIVSSKLSSAENVSEAILLYNATWNYTLTYTATNYSDASIARWFIVNKGITNISLWLNGTEGNAAIIYPSAANITANINITDNLQNAFTLYMNGTNVTDDLQQSTATIKYTNDSIPARGYNFTAYYNGSQNYTSFTINYNLTVSKSVSNTTLWLNDTQNNKTYEKGVAVGFVANVNTTYNVTLNLITNTTSWALVSGNSKDGSYSLNLTNSTSTSWITVSPPGVNSTINVTAYFEGNENFTASSQTYWMYVQDTTAPSVFVYNYTINGTFRKSGDSLLLNIYVSDNDIFNSPFNCTVKINNSLTSPYGNITNTSAAWCNATVTLPTSFAPDGNKTVNVSVSDYSGNTGMNTTFAVQIDDTGPTVTVTEPYPATNTWYRQGGSMTINATATDSGVGLTGDALCNASIANATYTLFLPAVYYSSALGKCTGTIIIPSASPLGDGGGKTFRINVSDTLGNSGSGTQTNVGIDNTAPTLTWDAPANDSVQTSTAFILRVNVTDTGGSTVTASTCTIKFNTTDIGTAPYNATSGQCYSSNFTMPAIAPLGIGKLYAYVSDVAGNEGSAWINISYSQTDTTPPSVTDSGPSGTVTSLPITLYFNTSEDGYCKYDTSSKSFANMRYTMSGSTINNHTTSLTASSTPAIAEGWNYFYVACNDTVGNSMTSLGTISFYYSTAPSAPTLTGINGKTENATTTNDTTPTFYWSDVGVSNYTLQLVDLYTATNISTTTYTNTTALTAGAWYWRVLGTNARGTAGSYSTIYEFTIDVLPPTLSVATPNGTTQNNFNYVTIGIQTNERSICRYSTSISDTYNTMTLMGSNSSGLIHNSSATVNGGTNTFYVRCRDAYLDSNGQKQEIGNEGSLSVIQFTVDATLPEINITITTSTSSAGFTNLNNITTSTPNMTIITSETATCRFDNISTTNFDSMRFTMYDISGTNHTLSLGTLLDNWYTYWIACKDSYANNQTTTVMFKVDTRTNYNVTRPDTFSDYWNVGWHSFLLPQIVLQNTSLQYSTGTYNVTNVLTSVAGKYTIIYYNPSNSSTSWTSYTPGVGGGLITFNDQSGSIPYWIYINVSNSRLQIS